MVKEKGFPSGRSGTGKPSFARRTYLIKQRFQLPFAFYPIFFFGLFIVCAGFYLHGHLVEILEYYIYSSHNDLENVWSEVRPEVFKVAITGGTFFVVVMGLWVGRHFSVLKSDLRALGGWLGRGRLEAEHDQLYALKDFEVRALGEKLYLASEGFEAWEREAQVLQEKLSKAAHETAQAPEEEFLEKLSALRRNWRWHWDKLGEIKVDEELS